MKNYELLNFLKDKKVIHQSDIEMFGIGESEIQELCLEFNWTLSEQKNDDGTVDILFKDEEDNVISDFSKYVLDDGYYGFMVQFQNMDDLHKFEDKLPCIKPFHPDARINCITIDPGNVVTVKFRRPKKNKVDQHSLKCLSYFKEWRDLPEYYYNFKISYEVRFWMKFNKQDWTYEKLANLFEQTFSKRTDSLWFPKKEVNDFNYFRVLGGNTEPQYPIYIVSKGRSYLYNLHSSFWLSIMKIHHYICVEPSDFENYSNCKLNESEYCHILQMDMSYKGKYNTLSDTLGNVNSTGSGAARNFCADHAKSNGFHWCWILDDNIHGFHRIWRGRKIVAYTPEVFNSLERFVNRYTNIGLAGLNYSMFVVNNDQRPPYILNSKVYSFGLWNLDCPFIYQEGRYNEDVIQSLKVMDAGWCTVQWNLYTGNKLRTQTLKGGNTEEIYGKQYGGTFSKTQMLVERFPQYANLVWKFSRWHHNVDYTSFKQELQIKPEFKYLHDMDYNKINENGAYIVRIPKEIHLTENDTREYLEKMYPRGCPEDITQSLIYCVNDRNNIELRNFWDFEDVPECDQSFYRPQEVLNSMMYGDKEQKIVETPLFDNEDEKDNKNCLNSNTEIREDGQEIHLTDKLNKIQYNIDVVKKQNSEDFNIDNL